MYKDRLTCPSLLDDGLPVSRVSRLCLEILYYHTTSARRDLQRSGSYSPARSYDMDAPHSPLVGLFSGRKPVPSWLLERDLSWVKLYQSITESQSPSQYSNTRVLFTTQEELYFPISLLEV